MDAPFGFRHRLDPGLFGLDRLDELFRRAPEGKAEVQLADAGKERPPGASPTMTKLEGSLAEDLSRRKLHVHMHDLPEWAPEYAAAREHVLEAAGIDRSQPRYGEMTVIRVFSPETTVAYHADGETQIDCGVGGRNVWHVYPPDALTVEENERLLRGGHFLPWREAPLVESYDLSPGDAFAAPPRWPHWIEHPGDEPAVSFEVGYWTADDVRTRKVWEVNWLMRKLHLSPRPPGEDAGRDARKRQVFDVVSIATRKGSEFRGI